MFRTTQVLSEYGCFGKYLCCFGRELINEYYYCENSEYKAHHILEVCSSFREDRRHDYSNFVLKRCFIKCSEATKRERDIASSVSNIHHRRVGYARQPLTHRPIMHAPRLGHYEGTSCFILYLHAALNNTLEIHLIHHKS